MKLTYIYHSGFALEGDGYSILIDYYRDTEEPFGYINDYLLKRPGKLYILSTHFHPDHFNSSILKWKEQREDIIYIFSKDILRRRRAQRDDAYWLIKGGEYQDETINIKAFGSTDVGISFLIKVDGKSIFHAGDLNNWHWNEESEEEEIMRHENEFLGEMKDINKVFDHVDIAMFPVDARLGKDYMRGPTQFLERVKSDLFVPMHFSETSYKAANAFKPIAEVHGSRFWELHRKGNSIEI